MEWASRFAGRAGIAVLLLVAGTGCFDAGPPDDDDGDDKPPPGCKYITGHSEQDFSETPIPAGFFNFDGRICAPFGGTVSYVGLSLDQYGSGAADTIVHRDGDPIAPSAPVGTEGAVNIEIVALRLASAEPITVFCDSEPTAWNVTVDLSEVAAPKGRLTAIKTHANGGTASSTLFIHPRLTFTYVEDPSVVRVFDTALEGFAPTQFDANFPWAYADDPDDPAPETSFLAGGDRPAGTAKHDLPGGTDYPALSGADSNCTRHVTPAGDQVHETCTVAD